MASLTVKFDVLPIWYEVETDCSKCSNCKQIIVTNMHELYVSISRVDDPLKFSMKKTDIVVCDHCKIVLEEIIQD